MSWNTVERLEEMCVEEECEVSGSRISLRFGAVALLDTRFDVAGRVPNDSSVRKKRLKVQWKRALSGLFEMFLVELLDRFGAKERAITYEDKDMLGIAYSIGCACNRICSF